MAAAHFLLPQFYGWKQYLDLVPHALGSAILGINFVFSFLLLWGGCMSIMAGIRSKPLAGVPSGIMYALAGFWIVYVLYQLRVPPPVPDVVRRSLLAIALVIAMLYLLFLFTRRVEEKSEPASKA
jgi:hypothetical protein